MSSSCLIWSKPLKRVMKKCHDSTILKEKYSFSSKLNTTNDKSNKERKKSSEKSKINEALPEQTISISSSPEKKTPKKPQTSQSNTLDVWLSKKGEEKKLNVKDKFEKENQKYKHEPKKFKIKTPTSDATHDVPSQFSTNHEPKVKSQHNLEETSAGIIKSSKKRSERETKHAKGESNDSHQRRLDTYSNQDNKRTKHESEKKWKKIIGHLCDDTEDDTKKKNKDRHKQDFINNNDSAKKMNRSKAEFEKYLFSPSTNSLEDKFKELDKLIFLANNKKMDKHTSHNRNKSSSSTIKENNSLFSKEGAVKDKHNNRGKTAYKELPFKIESNVGRENLDKKSKSRKRSRSESNTENSCVKQENLNSSHKHPSINKDIHHDKTGVTEDTTRRRSKEHIDKNKKSSKRSSGSKTKREHGVKNSQEKLDSYFTKNSRHHDEKRKSITRTESNESCELPSFKNVSSKTKKPKKDEFLKKYGMTIPSVEEILKDQKDLEKYKQQIESFKAMENKTFELPFSVKDLNRSQESYENILGCKHLSIDEITEAFKNNLEYISDIFHGKIFNERHDRFYNNTNYSLTTKDLCYSTSMIVFDFEQKEHMISMLKNEFDPDDKWTAYFFQVLLPELCMKIFMNTHGMSYDEAVKYLDTRPILDD